jgi:anti-sigma regulatory factor (Ser/Thr protein kinase)
LRRFLDKVIKKPVKGIQIQPSSPSLSADLSYADLDFFTKRGFLAIKISQYLNLPKDDGEYLFHQSLYNSSFMNFDKETHKEFILYLSELMLNWSKQKQDIPHQVKNTNLRNDIQNAMLKAYEIYKHELFSQPLHKEELTRSEEQLENTEWKVHRDVIFAATQGHFLLISEEELDKYKTGNLFCEGEIRERSDIPICRNDAKESLEKRGFNKSKVMSWLLVLSEAITNTIKHAESGKMMLIEDLDSNEIRFIIEDNGPGFSLEDLPNMTLLAGYSTKRSMGQGFTLMMKMTKQVILYTSSEGSTIILCFDSSKEKEGNINAAV